MTNEPPYIAASRDFVSFVRTAKPEDARLLERLAQHLDRLALVYSETEDCEPTSQDMAPTKRDDKLGSDVADAFGHIGPYLDVYPADAAEIGDHKVVVCDGVDDILDILADLEASIWLYENSSERDARWQFRFGFQFHWGRHLRDLSGRLHYMLYGF